VKNDYGTEKAAGTLNGLEEPLQVIPVLNYVVLCSIIACEWSSGVTPPFLVSAVDGVSLAPRGKTPTPQLNPLDRRLSRSGRYLLPLPVQTQAQSQHRVQV
jgi:hypothetical protein